MLQVNNHHLVTHTATMKAFIALVVALAIFETVNAVTKAYIARATAAKDKCMKEYNIQESEIEEYIKTMTLPEDKNGKCAVNCYLEELKLMSNGQMNVAEIKANHREKWDDPAVLANADQVTDECNAELNLNGQNKCDSAVEVVRCMVIKGKERNIPIPDYRNPTRR